MVKPVVVVVFPIKLIIVSIETKGFPLQLIEIKLNILCSILFHLLVPGGKWHTRIIRPAAKVAILVKM